MEKKLVKMKLADLVPYANNPRKNTKAIGAVAESIEQTGYNNPIIVDENNVILAGHTRLASLKKLGRKEAEVLVVSGLTEEQKKKYRLLDNKAGEFASWDYVALMEEMEGLDWKGLDLDWGIEGKDDAGAEFGNVEYGEEDFGDEEFEYECPECGFRFNA